MDASRVAEVVQLLQMMQNCPRSQAYDMLYKTASMTPVEAELFRAGYWYGFEKALNEALRIVNERLTPYE